MSAEAWIVEVEIERDGRRWTARVRYVGPEREDTNNPPPSGAADGVHPITALRAAGHLDVWTIYGGWDATGETEAYLGTDADDSERIALDAAERLPLPLAWEWDT